ncbi:MAG: polymer-forming cytoskeletal protein [Bacteroidota bacterium]|nr:polymer-forming cytoskeletal protein [Bacteroidota bacterium]
MAKIQTANPNVVNQIMEGTKITGDIESNDNIRIAGILAGKLTTKGKLVVGKEGVIKGTIVCANCDIEGSIEGKITVENLLMLKSTAKIKGEVFTDKLAIESGAVFNATCDMSGDQKTYEGGKKEKTVK